MDLTPKEFKRAMTITKRLRALGKMDRILPPKLQKFYRTYQDKWVAELQGYYDKRYGEPMFTPADPGKTAAMLTVFDAHKKCPSFMWGMMPNKQQLHSLVKDSTGVDLWDTTKTNTPNGRRSNGTVVPTECSVE